METVLTPQDVGTPKRLGKRVFRKEVLPVGKVDHPRHKLDFTADRLRSYAERFTSRVDPIPFVLADADNRHTDDPERFRGEVIGLEASDSGLFATIETTEAGAALIDDNPKLGVSVRINPADEIEHVCGTLRPRAKGMKPWESVDFSDDAEVIDLSASEYSSAMSDAIFTPEQEERIQAMFAERESAEDKPALSDEEIQRIVDGVKPEDAEETPGETPAEPVALSEADERRITELSDSNAELQRKLADAEFERTRDRLLRAGVPRASIDLAEPIIRSGESQTIELSEGQSTNASARAIELLEAQAGTVSFSEEGEGSSTPDDDSDFDEAWERQSPTPGVSK